MNAPAAIRCPPPAPPTAADASTSASWRSTPRLSDHSFVRIETFVTSGSSTIAESTIIGFLQFSLESAIPAPIPTMVSGNRSLVWIYCRCESSVTPVSRMYWSRSRMTERWWASMYSASR